uniref:Uncharacterized protein n=1 Tax=Neobodo designis TaxID=312471 RepID=A0A7S1LZR3_NEODS|mmetsp:Transcript_31589/g.97599  ORF Transcript_31589/g.97599 Transcript_31589/m.97599 type:complete len:316 (+) Transcript_31589:65-1012(+)
MPHCISVASFVAAVTVALLATLVAAQTQYTMRITITDPTFRSGLFETTLGSYAEHRDSCPCSFLAVPPQGTGSRTVTVVFALQSGSSASCVSSLRNVMNDQGNNGPSFRNFNAALQGQGVGTLVSITVANPAPPGGDGDDNDQNKTWIFVGAGCVAGLVVLLGVAVLFIRGKERRQAMQDDAAQGDHLQPLAGDDSNKSASSQGAATPAKSALEEAPRTMPRETAVATEQSPEKSASSTPVEQQPSEAAPAAVPVQEEAAPSNAAPEEQPAKTEEPAPAPAAEADDIPVDDDNGTGAEEPAAERNAEESPASPQE